ncbi:hypothetical protein I79_013854 [Cricetulus griseus]|uniref:Uncharacterized protein n=1 Tax=Cricetulus griseus TaxID=10029 RepID=G3HSM0_CRIGR|nr:hypothetical protein I79_013854 [Cricetulus griseus]
MAKVSQGRRRKLVESVGGTLAQDSWLGIHPLNQSLYKKILMQEKYSSVAVT